MLLALAVCSAHHARAAWVIDGRLAPLVSAVVPPRNQAPYRQRSRGVLLMNDNAEDEDDGAIDMAALAARIEEVSNAPGPEDVRLLVLDSMVPGQKLTLDAIPAALVNMLKDAEEAKEPVIMVGRERLRLHSHGVECEVHLEEYTGDAAPWSNVADAGSSDDPGGQPAMSVTFTAGSLVEITQCGPDEGSRWLGRVGKAKRVALDSNAPEERPTETLIARCQELEERMIQWLKLVRSTKRERSPGQLERILADLGPLPEADQPSARALWIAGLINPLPALGVALEIRPAVLTAATADLRVGFALFGINDSIERLERPGPAF